MGINKEESGVLITALVMISLIIFEPIEVYVSWGIAILFGLFVTYKFYRKDKKSKNWLYLFLFVLAGAFFITVMRII